MAAWLGITDAHYHSSCGAENFHTFERALEGIDYWAHYTTQTHIGIVDLLQSYYITKVRARSNGGYDPTEVNIYINDTGEAPWGDAVASGIDTWQNRTDWDGTAVIDITPKTGRYIKIEVIDTENVDNHLTFGASAVFRIFDVYGSVITVLELSGTITAQSGLTGNVLSTELLAGLIETQSALTGNLRRLQELAGLVEAQSGATGSLQWLQELAGLIEAQSGVTGNVNSTLVYSLAGSLAGLSGVTGNILSTEVLAGSVAGISAVTGNLQRLMILSGLIEAQSGVTGNLQWLQELAGLVEAQSVVTGELTSRFTDIPPFMEKDLIDPYSSGAWLWLAEIKVPTKDAVRIARNTEGVRYDGNDFEKFNLEIGAQTFSGDGSIPRLTLRTFQDATRQIETIIDETEGALGGAIKLIRVNEKWLTSPVDALEADYDLLASQSDSEWCTFTLGIPNLLTQRFPLRDYSSSICPWATPSLWVGEQVIAGFKGPECQLALDHPHDECTGTFDDCYTNKDNAVHWGAELGLSPSITRLK